MSDRRIGDEDSELRPERLGERSSLRSESLGLEAAGGPRPTSPAEGWQTFAAGATAGRIVRFETVEEMRRFVADLEEAFAALLAGRPGRGEGPVWLLVYLAGHRILRADDPADSGEAPER